MLNQLTIDELGRRHAHLIDLLTTEEARDRLDVRQFGPRLSKVLEDDPYDTGQRNCEKPAHNPPQEHPRPQGGEDQHRRQRELFAENQRLDEVPDGNVPHNTNCSNGPRAIH